MSKAVSQISRTDFVKAVTAFVGSAISLAIGLPALNYIIAPGLHTKQENAWILLGPLVDYPIGVPGLVSFTRTQINGWEKTVNSYGVFVVRQNETQVRVFSNICTHLSCRVSWHADIQHYVSPCHDGHFDILGAVISGPPPRPLDEFVTKVEDGNLLIQFPPFKRS